MRNNIHDVADAAEQRMVGAVSGVTARLHHHLGPPLTRVRATLAALSYNDDQVSVFSPLIEVIVVISDAEGTTHSRVHVLTPYLCALRAYTPWCRGSWAACGGRLGGVKA